MDYYVYSRASIEGCALHVEAEHIIISIQTPNDPHGEARLPICEQTLGVLRLVFHDLDQAPPPPTPGLVRLGFNQDEIDAHMLGVPSYTLFDATRAREVVEFARKHHPRAKRLLVHCDAGMSRSPAVAAALASGLYGDGDGDFFRAYHPNRRVYHHILRALED